jgi:hypothetical protein
MLPFEGCTVCLKALSLAVLYSNVKRIILALPIHSFFPYVNSQMCLSSDSLCQSTDVFKELFP